jgi:Uma2 family endonuclease
MSSNAGESSMATVISPPERRVILRNVSWGTYERLLTERGVGTLPRFSFDQGDLEIMSPSGEHEEYKCTLARIVGVVAEELSVNTREFGSTTFKREDVSRGFEPDACFYIQGHDRMRGRRRVDLLVDPPPDLIIEIDLSADSLKKLGIYAALGVPEVWRYDGKVIEILALEDQSYVKRGASLSLALLTPAVLAELIEERISMDSIPWVRKLRKWVRDQVVGE